MINSIGMINAGKYNRKISICNRSDTEDSSGFQVFTPEMPPVLQPFAQVKTAKGITLIKNNSDFEKAYVNFTIRYPHKSINRDMLIVYRNKIYTIEYLNDVDQAHVELEIQAKEVTH